MIADREAYARLTETISRAIAVQQDADSEDWRAFEDIAEAVLAAMGLSDPWQNPKCLECGTLTRIMWGKYGAFFACPKSTMTASHPTFHIDKTPAGRKGWGQPKSKNAELAEALPAPESQAAETEEAKGSEGDS